MEECGDKKRHTIIKDKDFLNYYYCGKSVLQKYVTFKNTEVVLTFFFLIFKPFSVLEKIVSP